jgi:hypothetical protein
MPDMLMQHKKLSPAIAFELIGILGIMAKSDRKQIIKEYFGNSLNEKIHYRRIHTPDKHL